MAHHRWVAPHPDAHRWVAHWIVARGFRGVGCLAGRRYLTNRSLVAPEFLVGT
ncbi:hypothetical protein ADILRU_2271 [Leifsonia rubra CMS 76R]|nr:hypothetical protein ADILRU_2271 [Leifsonia rubra CMS 76R]